MGLAWDSKRNMFVNTGDGGSGINVTGSDGKPSTEAKAVVAVVDTVGGAALDAFGLHSITELIRQQWANAGYRDK